MGSFHKNHIGSHCNNFLVGMMMMVRAVTICCSLRWFLHGVEAAAVVDYLYLLLAAFIVMMKYKEIAV